MKTLLASLSLAFSLTAHAALLNLNPGGFNLSTNTEINPATLTLLQHLGRNEIVLFDAFLVQPPEIDGWTNATRHGGQLDGGILFNTSLADPAPVVSVNWSLFGTGYSMGFLDVFALDSTGTLYESVFQVAPRSRWTDLDSITVNPDSNIYLISFYGKTPFTHVPESGSTFVLLLIGLLGLCFSRLRLA